MPRMNKAPGQTVWRARFSAISAPEVKSAMVQDPHGMAMCFTLFLLPCICFRTICVPQAKLGQPNKNEADSVDARAELDLKVVICEFSPIFHEKSEVSVECGNSPWF